MAAAATSSSSMTGTVAPKKCFNSNCKAVLERVNKGWRRRTGEFAELCDRCASVYEGGNFCETFHLNASGWRCCETCGKQVHCGCIVSFHMFVLLDAGGIECITCARNSFILTPNPAWPPPSIFLPVQPERVKDISSTRNWPAMVGSGPVPWRQAPSVFNGTSIQPDLVSRAPIDVDRHRFNERLSSPPIEKRKMEESFDRLMNGSLKINCSSVIGGNGTPVVNSVEQLCSSPNYFQQTANSTTSGSSSALVSTSNAEMDNHRVVVGTTALQPTVYPQAEKRTYNQNQADISEAQPCNGKAKGDARGRGQLLPRYWPRISEEELQKISEHSNSVITPLFEKMLSASDAGRIGRLVLPKKCAEAYFPPISQPEGVPLKAQDLKGKEWVFQFRFWPNNNSRMYVLEGIMPCIQSMQLQAGDIVTFSRIEPEGKLVMGCRKASSTSSDKGNETCSLKSSSNVEGVDKSKKIGELGPTNQGDTSSSPCLQQSNQQTGELASDLYEADNKQVGVAGKVNSSVRGKKKNITVGLKRKRLRIDNEDVLELKVTWEQVQELFRPPPDKIPTVCVIEGCEFEEFEEAAPVIGRPTIHESDHQGKNVQWVQCEKCYKWRKVPTDAFLKSYWTCSDNMWDPSRSQCSSEEEITVEKLKALLTTKSNDSSDKKKMNDLENLEALEGLDALADLAIQEKAASQHATTTTTTSTKHPRHKAGCSCIVCIQPPSGKAPKHKQPCDCVFCVSLKRRLHTITLKRELKLSEMEQQQQQQRPASPLKGEIDLNIQPDSVEEDRPSGIVNQKLSENVESSDSEETTLEAITQVNHQMQQRMSEFETLSLSLDGIGNSNINNRDPPCISSSNG